MAKDPKKDDGKPKRPRKSADRKAPAPMGYSTPGSISRRSPRTGEVRTSNKSSGKGVFRSAVSGRYIKKSKVDRVSGKKPSIAETRRDSSLAEPVKVPDGYEMYWVGLTIDRPDYTMPEVARFLDILDQAWILASNIAEYKIGDEKLSTEPPRPDIHRLQLQSPFLVELREIAVPTGTVALAFSLFVYILKHPAELAAWLPTIVQSWHENWSKAEIAKRDRALIEHATSKQYDIGQAEANPQIALNESAQNVSSMLDYVKPTAIEGSENLKLPE